MSTKSNEKTVLSPTSNEHQQEMASLSQDQSTTARQVPRHDCADASSLREISIIENMASFLEANGGAGVDHQVLQNMADALAKRLNDTSPGTLQDVTMENTYGVGYRSPCVSLQQYQGSTSPAAHGRSVREFEEQMSNLRKENFNLKLRLYFIEESIPGYQQHANSNEGQESSLKQHIDSKVEIEMLRREIQEKQDILKEAAQAMNLMEQKQKDTEAKSQAIVDELNQKIQYLEMERDMGKTHNDEYMNEPSENINPLQKIRELQLEGMLKQSEDKIMDFQAQITKLDDLLMKRDETIKEYEDKVKELAFQNAELVEALENKENTDVNNAQIERLREELHQHKTQLADKICMLQEAEEKILSRDQVHEQSCRTIKKLLLNIKNQHDEINRLKNLNTSATSAPQNNSMNKENSNSGSTAIECTGLCRSVSDSEALHELSIGEKKKLEQTIEQQEAQIQKLKAEVKKKTANLQNLVNKELWEKNREIERLTKLLNQRPTNNSKPTISPLSPNTSIEAITMAAHDSSSSSGGGGGGELHRSADGEDANKALERNKLLQRKVDMLIKRLSAERNNETLIMQLRHQVREAQCEAESAEKWRRECADVCAILSNRLEELAGFLNSLLKHKDVLGLLAADRRRAMRKAVDRSLDISKSLNMTLSITGLSMGDQSLAQLSNLSDILGDVEGRLSLDMMTGAVNRTFNSHEELLEQQSIETLKAENKALKHELDKRRSAEGKKDRRSLPLPVPVPENQSESEAWSEPDRKVSLARIGLEDHSVSLLKVKEGVLAQRCSGVGVQAAAGSVETDSESGDVNNQSRNTSSTKTLRTQERIAQLEQNIAKRDERILEIQCQLVEADNRLKKENLRVIEMTQEMEQLRQHNEELYADLIGIGAQETIEVVAATPIINNESLLQHQIDQKTRSLEKLQEERDRIVVEARLAELQISSMHAEMDKMREKHEQALTAAAEQEKQKLECLQRDMDALMQQRIREKELQHKEALERDWIARSLYEETSQQLGELQRQFIEAQRTIDYLSETNQEMKQTLVDNELAARSLKKQLDESTLQASKTVLERTKALNEKLQLEKRVQALKEQLCAHETERAQLQRQMNKLDTSHAALKEKYAAVKKQQQQQQQHRANNNSDVSQSGYTSEEVPQEGQETENNNGSSTAEGKTFARTTGVGATADKRQNYAAAVGAQRHNNSSPDLGIESDAGRVSSVELSQAQRSLHKTVELSGGKNVLNNIMIKEEINGGNTEMSADIKREPSGGVSIQHDCAKVEQENAELRRKLIRTKRAFEDTYEKLRVANERKAQIEKDIKNQILKTHNVLKNVRSNMENEL